MATTNRLQGLTTSGAVKPAVLVASTGNLTLSSTQVVDGIAVSSCDRVLVKDQTTASENGIYIVDTGDWSRAIDFDGAFDAYRGTFVYISTGTANGGRFFGVSSTGGNIPGTNTITFSEFTLGDTLGAPLNTNGHAINESEGTAVLSSAETNIWVTDGNTVHVSSSPSPTITSFSTAPNAGASRRVIYDSSFTLVHSTTAMILPSSANILTLAGDISEVYAETTSLARLANYEPIDGRDFTEVETVSSGGASIRNSGITIISTDSTSGMAALELAAPVMGSHKEIINLSSATALTLDTTATTITMLTGSSGTNVGTTELTWAGPNLYGAAIVLRGLSGTQWSVVRNNSAVVSS